METIPFKELKVFVDWEDLADWEKGRVWTEPIDVERQEAYREIENIRRKAKTREDLVPACLIRDEFLCRYPDDKGMIQYGSNLIRSWEWMGGTFEEMQERLKQEYLPEKRSMLSSAA
jgi:hypothetical protein